MLHKGKVAVLFIVSTVLLVIPLAWHNVTTFKYDQITTTMNWRPVIVDKTTASTSSSYISTDHEVYNHTTEESTVKITSPTTQLLTTPIPTVHIEWVHDFEKKGVVPSSKLPDKSQLWTKDVRLCIMFNMNNMRPNPDSINLLLAYYLPFFDYITVIFDGLWNKKPDYLPEYVSFYGCQSHIGWYMHKCLNICINQHNNLIKGYLFISDDMFVNLNKMKNFDLTRLWYIQPIPYRYSDLMTKDGVTLRSWWWWWGNPYHNERPLKTIFESFPEIWRQKLIENAGFPDRFQVRCLSDLIYIPCSLCPSLTKVLTHVIQTDDLFFEIAVPLSLGVVSHPSERVLLTSAYLWGGERNANRIKREAEKNHFVHPVKLSKVPQANLWRSLMETQVKNANL